MMSDIETIKALRTAYAVAGAECHRGLAAYYALPAIVALSTACLKSGVTRYRIATLADGTAALAERKPHGDYRVAITAERAAAYLTAGTQAL